MAFYMAAKRPAKQSFLVESLPTAVNGVCKKMLEELIASSFTKDDVFCVHLAVQEAFINAALHGNNMEPDKKVKIEYSVTPDMVEISMSDQGGGFNPDEVPDPRHPENLYKPQGRGLLLMRSYMDLVEFNKLGNSVRMVKYKENRQRSHG
jgi:serine/threonine-protein kinase RsbW